MKFVRNSSSHLEQAREFAREAHESIKQVRKFTGEPYYFHPQAVADLVAQHGGTDAMIMAAELHDVAEDVLPKNPFYSLEEIARRFGSVVAFYVSELTDLYTPEAYPEWNRERRKKAEAKRVRSISSAAKTIKLADVLHNTKDIVEFDPKFAQIYLKETQRKILGLLHGGNPQLYRLVVEQLREKQELLRKSIFTIGTRNIL